MFFRYLLIISFLVSSISITAIDAHGLPFSLLQQNTLSISTIHGSLDITDPLLIELINCPAMQRLKNIRQYGTTDYVLKHVINYSRFEHSLGVFYLLHTYGASYIEQLAGLLHDISHTVFSHACDPLFMGNLLKGAYQDMIHEQFLNQHGIKEILEKHGIKVSQIMPKNEQFRALEQDLPALCADRIEYNIFAAHMDNLLSEQDIQAIHKDLHFDGHNWYFDTLESAKNFAAISLHQTVYMWGSPLTILSNYWTSQVLKRAMDIGLITKEDICYNDTDDNMWRKLCACHDQSVTALVNNIKVTNTLFSWPCNESETATNVRAKFRGVNPLVKTKNGLQELSKVDAEFKEEYETIKQHMKKGWNIVLNDKPSTNTNTMLHDPRENYPLVSQLQKKNSAYCC